MLLVKYATRGRAEWFRKAIANIVNTISNPDYLIVVTCDDDDSQMNNGPMREFMRQHESIVTMWGKSTSKIDAINRNMPEGIDWDILVTMSDDMVFVFDGWDNVIRQRMVSNFPQGDCFLHFPDGYANEALSTMSIMDRKYYERDKYIYHPSYKSFSCDAEAMYVAMMRGRHKFFPEIIFMHQHPSTGKIPNDALYQKNSTYTDHDTKNYFERLKRNFDEPAGHDILRAQPELQKYL